MTKPIDCLSDLLADVSKYVSSNESGVAINLLYLISDKAREYAESLTSVDENILIRNQFTVIDYPKSYGECHISELANLLLQYKNTKWFKFGPYGMITRQEIMEHMAKLEISQDFKERQ